MKLNAWELCALEMSLTKAIDRGEIEKHCGEKLLTKIRNYAAWGKFSIKNDPALHTNPFTR